MGADGKIAGEDVLIADGELGLFAGAASDAIVHGTYRRTGKWAPELLELLTKRLLCGGGTLLDIGANIGLVAVPTTERTQCRTLAFEPDPCNAALLRRNIALHGLDQSIEVHELALFSSSGAMSLGRDASNHGDQRLLTNDVAESPSVRVRTACLDTLVEPATLARPVVAKIDTQGAEVDVLAGAQRTLAQIEHAIVEVWPAGLARVGRTLEELIEALAAHFSHARLLLAGEPIWPLAGLRTEFARLDAVATLHDEDTFFDILVGHAAGPPQP